MKRAIDGTQYLCAGYFTYVMYFIYRYNTHYFMKIRTSIIEH
jgi:hypothetical protein